MKNNNFMSKICLALFLVLFSVSAFAQTTNWYGEIKVQGAVLPITLNIEKKADTTIILMGSPAQTKEMFSVTKQRIEGDSIIFSIKNMSIVYRGKLNKSKDEIVGVFKQGLLLTDLTFKKLQEKFEYKRPQEPKPPFSYVEQELSFTTPGVDYDFKGTLTLPSKEGKYPCVILITGSGLQNRDEEVFGHKPFKVIADYLTKNGIAVFRYDDRGWGSKNAELFNATSLDYVKDAQSAFNMLKSNPNIDSKKIGMLGHSEGGLIAPICASQNKDIAFVILLAGPGVSGYDVLMQQNKEIMQKAKASKFQINSQLDALSKINVLIRSNVSSSELETKMNTYFDSIISKLSEKKKKDYQYTSPAARTQFISQINLPWMRTFFVLDPQDYLPKLSQPVLALNGDKDIQVISKYNLPAIKKAMKIAKNNNFEYFEAKGMNHLFQECKEGTIDEYQTIEQTISPIILEKLKTFIQKYSK